MDLTKNSFVSAMMDYFGKLPGQTTMDFANELKALNTDDREEFKRLLKDVGYTIH